ncbi:MAG: gliding motility-associated protein GldE [Saprospiraceae bacterium]|nr:gliding motility-associated protein GldE [Saprospiraceae bacterium]
MDPDPDIFFLSDCLFTCLLFIPIEAVGYSVSILLLLLCSGAFSGSETAIFSLTKAELDVLSVSKVPGASALSFLKNRHRHLLALILVCNTVVNIGIALSAEQLLSLLISSEGYERWGASVLFAFPSLPFSASQIGYTFYFMIAVIGATTLILLFGELMPKIYSLINAKKFAIAISTPLRILYYLLYPITHVMVLMTRRVENKLSSKRIGLQATTKEDLDTAIDLALTTGSREDKQVNILKGIIKFNDVTVKRVMTPRTDIYGIEFSTGFAEALETVRECGFSRLPVYTDDYDQITGILYSKDLIAHLEEGPSFEWQRLIRTDVLYVPESKKLKELLNEFRDQHKHMAIVVDEYGGTHGLVTMEDIMEEIVGEIKDEFDEQHELNFVRLDPHNYLFDGKTLINDMCRVLGLEITLFEEARGNADSIAGLILEHCGDMPHKDQVIEIMGNKFTIASVSKKRIEQVKVTI